VFVIFQQAPTRRNEVTGRGKGQRGPFPASVLRCCNLPRLEPGSKSSKKNNHGSIKFRHDSPTE
jgi:hypothetical protein